MDQLVKTEINIETEIKRFFNNEDEYNPWRIRSSFKIYRFLHFFIVRYK